MENPTQFPLIKTTKLGGLNLRSSRSNLNNGEFDRVLGVFPSQNGLQSRLLGKLILMYLQGQNVRNLHQTFDGQGSVLVQAGSTLYTFPLDFLLNRFTAYNVTQGISEEEAYGTAYILHDEANTVNGGSAQGYQNAASDASSTAGTFYGRRLTAMPVNETVNTLLTVNTFNAATGGGGSASVAGNFVLVPGIYRISMWMTYSCFGGNANGEVVWGLYNTTSSAFEVHSGTTTPILGSVIPRGTGSAVPGENYTSFMEAFVTVSSVNKTYEVRHKIDTQLNARLAGLCGYPTTMATANVNGAAARNTYGLIQIIRFS